MSAARLVVVAVFCWLASAVVVADDVPTAARDAAEATRFEPDIAAFEARDALAPPPRDAILFIGSSSIRFWQTLDADFPDRVTVNRGFGGSLLPDATRFAGRVIVPYRPSAIVLYAGDNDLNEGHSPERVADDFRAFVARVRRDLPDVPIVYLAIKPSPARAALLPLVRDANARIATIATSMRAVTFVDVASPMLDDAGVPRAELFGPDALHMNAAGYALWRRLLAPVLASLPRNAAAPH